MSLSFDDCGSSRGPLVVTAFSALCGPLSSCAESVSSGWCGLSRCPLRMPTSRAFVPRHRGQLTARETPRARVRQRVGLAPPFLRLLQFQARNRVPFAATRAMWQQTTQHDIPYFQVMFARKRKYFLGSVGA